MFRKVLYDKWSVILVQTAPEAYNKKCKYKYKGIYGNSNTRKDNVPRRVR